MSYFIQKQQLMMTLVSVIKLLIATMYFHDMLEPFNVLTPGKVSQTFPLIIPETVFPLERSVLFPH